MVTAVDEIRLGRAGGHLPRENWGIRLRNRLTLEERKAVDTATLTELATELNYRDRQGKIQEWGSCREDWLIPW